MPGQWIISRVHYYQAHGWEHGGHSVKVKAMLLVAIIHFHCAPHSLSSHWYPIPNFCNSFIGSISTPFIHLNFNKLLHSIIVILWCCSSMMDFTLMTVHWNKISRYLDLFLWNVCYMTFGCWWLFYYKKDNRGSNVAKRLDNIFGYNPRPLLFVYLQEVYPIKQLPQTLYKTSRCYDRQLGGE